METQCHKEYQEIFPPSNQRGPFIFLFFLQVSTWISSELYIAEPGWGESSGNWSIQGK